MSCPTGAGPNPPAPQNPAPTAWTVVRTDVRFESHGVPCAADLYRPAEGRERVPCVVMGHGFSGTKGLGLPAYAMRFAAAGVAALALDYRHLGVSGGQPRHLIDVTRQRNDYRAAIRFARSYHGIDPDRIALWGTSLSGGHVLAVAATDPCISAVVAQVPLFDAARTGRTLRQRWQRALTPSVLKLLVAAGRDAIGGLLGHPPYLVPVVGEAGEAALYTEPDARAAFDAMGGETSGWRNAFAPRFVFALPRYRPGTVQRVQMPLLVCVAEYDLEASPAFAIHVARQAQRGEIRRYPVGHFEVYHGAVLEQVLADQIDFLRTYLLTTPGVTRPIPPSYHLPPPPETNGLLAARADLIPGSEATAGRGLRQ